MLILFLGLPFSVLIMACWYRSSVNLSKKTLLKFIAVTVLDCDGNGAMRKGLHTFNQILVI